MKTRRKKNQAKRHIEAQAKRMNCEVLFVGDNASLKQYRNGVWIKEIGQYGRQSDYQVYINKHGQYEPLEEANAQEVACARAILDWVEDYYSE